METLITDSMTMDFHFSDGWILNVCTWSPTTIPQIKQLSFTPRRMEPGLRWPALKPSQIIPSWVELTRLTNSVDSMVSAENAKNGGTELLTAPLSTHL